MYFSDMLALKINQNLLFSVRFGGGSYALPRKKENSICRKYGKQFDGKLRVLRMAVCSVGNNRKGKGIGYHLGLVSVSYMLGYTWSSRRLLGRVAANVVVGR